MAEILPGNGLRSSLAADLTSGATTLRIVTADATKWPTGGEYRAVICQDPSNGPYELVYVTGGQGTDTLTVTRAVEPYNGDQTARAWSTGASISAVITQNSLKNAAGTTFPLSQNLTFSPDNTYDIGAVAANRPRSIYAASSVVTPSIDSQGVALTVGPTTNNVLNFRTNNVTRWQISNTALLAGADNTYDIGASAANRPRTIYAATSFIGPGSVPTGGTTGQVLSKSSNSDYALTWITPGSGGITLPLAQNLTFSPDNTYDIGATSTTLRPRNIYAAGFFQTATGIYTPLFQSASGSLSFGTAFASQWQISTAGHFMTLTDNAYDIGASGANRPRDFYLGRNEIIGGTSQISGTLGIGVAPVTYSGLIFQPTMSGANQFALYAPLTFSTTGTGNNFVFYTLPTFAASTRTVASGASFYADSPTLGSGVTVTSMFGYYAANQGKSGVTNAYGVYIAAQSGATTTNIGLRNEGTTRLTGRVGINNDPWVDNTRYVAISGVVSIFNGTMSLDNGMGVGPNSATMLNVGGNLTGSATQNGMYFRVNGDATGTAQIIGVAVQVGTANGSYTAPLVTGFYVDGPIPGTGTTITNVRGINVVNQGGTGKTNAYGIYLQATSGASSANYSLYNLGNSFFGQQVYIGSLNQTIRNSVNSSASISIESADGYAQLQGKNSVLIGSNAYYDGTNWQRFTTANGAMHINFGGVTNTTFAIYAVPSGANPISGWTNMLTVDSVGNGNFGASVHAASFSTGPSFGGGWPIAGDLNVSRGGNPVTGYVFLGDSNHYVGYDGSQYRFYINNLLIDGSLTVTGNYIYLPDANTYLVTSSGYFYLRSANGLVVQNAGGTATQITCGPISISGAVLTATAVGGQQAVIANSGNGDLVLGGGASHLYMHPNFTVGVQQSYPNFNVFGFTGILCNGITTNSSRRYKKNITKITDALAMVMDPEVEGTHFLYNPPQQVEKDVPKYGLIAEPWERIAPDVVDHDADGLPRSMDYQQVTAILLQAFKEYVTTADTRILELETQVKELEKKA